MKKIYSLLLFFVPGLVIRSALAQDTDPQQYVMPTPEVSSFMKYGGQRPNLYTGTVEVSIPLYVYKDNDFEIPISLNYASNGYLPNKQAGSSGLGWYLSAGGYITRKVEGLRDESEVAGDPYGFYTFHATSYFSPGNEMDVFKKTEVLTTKVSIPGAYYVLPNMQHADTAPDIFTFNFLGHRGNFMMGFNRRVHTYNTNHPEGEYNVDLAEFQGDSQWQTGSTICITTGDGYKYTFARPGDMGCCLLYYPVGGPTFRDRSIPRLYWPLTEIKAPNGRKVTFEYGETEYCDNSQWFSTKYVREEYFNMLKTVRESVRQLKAIKVDGVAIRFDYGERIPEKVCQRNPSVPDMALNNSHLTPATLSSTKMLSCMTVRDGYEMIKTCNFRYSYASANDNPVLFLSEVHVDGTGTYKMSYYNEKDRFPAHSTTQLDHWGYYNVANGSVKPLYTISNIRPEVTVDSKNRETVISSNREPSFYGSRMGMLQKVEYPTGGYTRYYYEPHSYTRRLTRDFTNDNLPYLEQLENSREAGGVRIRKITDYKNDADSTCCDYIYSSGIMLHYPRYHAYDQYRCMNLVSYSLDETHMEYGSVTERFSDGSSIGYVFADYGSYPDFDFYSDQVMYYTGNYSPGSSNQGRFFAEPQSRAGFRGKLLQIFKYDRKGNLREEVRNVYDTRKMPAYMPAVKSNEHHYYIHKTLLLNYRQISTRMLAYPSEAFPSQSYQQRQIDYTYNLLGQCIEESHRYDDGKLYNIHVRYPADVVSNPESTVPEAMLYHYNLLNYPIKQWKGVQYVDFESQEPGPEKIIESRKFTYKLMKEPNIYDPEQFLKLFYVERGEIEAPTEEEPDYVWEKQITQYDQAGRPLEILDIRNNIRVCYVWGYGGLYPVAKIINWPLDELLPFMGLEDILNTPLPGCLSEAQEEKLRSVPNVDVTTYSYYPHIGLRTITDVNGHKRTYDYDEVGRLIRIWEDDAVASEYQYSPNTL